MPLRPLKRNWTQVLDEVRAAEAKADRPDNSVRVVGVTKYVDAEVTAALVQAGCRDLGENRPQTMWQKAETITADVQWHLIGHLQTNKVRRSLPHRPLIHSVDSAHVLDAISSEATRQIEDGRLPDLIEALLEVNISGDATKTGFSPSELTEILQTLPRSGVRVTGLMAMAGLDTNSTIARKQFSLVRELRDKIVTEFGCELPELSMGMSADFPEAIAEGATMVRIGSRLFAD